MQKSLLDAINDYRSGQLHEAIGKLQVLLDKGVDPEGQASYYLGLARYDLGMLGPAAESLKQAVERSPRSAMYHYRLGLVFARQMMLADARRELEETISINPEHQRARYMLGTIRFKNGDVKEARAIFQEIVSKTPDFAAAYFWRGVCSYHLGDVAAAKEDFQATVQMNPDYLDAYVKLGQLYVSEGRFEEAAETLGKVYEAGIREFGVIGGYVTALARLGRRTEAKAVIEAARQIYPNDPELQRLVETIADRENA